MNSVSVYGITCRNSNLIAQGFSTYGRALQAIDLHCAIISDECLSSLAKAWIESIGEGPELPKLEVLSAARSGLNDSGLAAIGIRCLGLLKLAHGNWDRVLHDMFVEADRVCVFMLAVM
nr:F-box/LRR-repeat protein 3-like [Ipomoea batatas]